MMVTQIYTRDKIAKNCCTRINVSVLVSKHFLCVTGVLEFILVKASLGYLILFVDILEKDRNSFGK